MKNCGYTMCTEKDCLHCYPVQKMDKLDYPPAGTWDVINRHGEPLYVVEHDGEGGWWGVCQTDRPEDCYVLAASKDLLAALKAMVENIEQYAHDSRNQRLYPTPGSKMAVAYAAIKKAEGK